MDKDITEVVFKKTKDGEIIAFFPYIDGTNYDTMMSYMHVGQHSEANLNYYHECKTAAPEEYKPLYDELENIIGYNLKVIKKLNYSRYINKETI